MARPDPRRRHLPGEKPGAGRAGAHRGRAEHTVAGHHINRETPFPDWADDESKAAAERLSEPEALSAVGDWAVAQAQKRSK
jgi:hypothetical protein